jgi:hypothetical protein
VRQAPADAGEGVAGEAALSTAQRNVGSHPSTARHMADSGPSAQTSTKPALANGPCGMLSRWCGALVLTRVRRKTSNRETEAAGSVKVFSVRPLDYTTCCR